VIQQRALQKLALRLAGEMANRALLEAERDVLRARVAELERSHQEDAPK
jgi:hypothetical protein